MKNSRSTIREPYTGRQFGPYAEALADFYEHRPERPPLFLVREDGFRSELPVELFFYGYEQLPGHERNALGLVSGKTLDVGSGAGRHSLVLMERGIEVTALDLEPVLIRIMIDRGLKHVVLSDVFNYCPTGKFRNILLLNHGLGIAGSLARLRSLLSHLAGMLEPDGTILADSLEVAGTNVKEHVLYQERIQKAGRYRGEIRMFLEYGSLKSNMIEWLHVDFNTLRDISGQVGLTCNLHEKAGTGEYVAVLKHAGKSSG